MAFYVKKPVVIEAFQLGVDNIPDWFMDKVTDTSITLHRINMDESPFKRVPVCCFINTLEGIMKGEYMDYIIQGIKGEIYPCKPDIFRDTHEMVPPFDSLEPVDL
jgi:hypothetical protein